MPTFTELAGGIPEPEVDGGSLVPLLLKGAAMGSNREDFLVDYYGEGSDTTGIYGPLPNLCLQGRERGGSEPMQSCGDAHNNTYHCVRYLAVPSTGITKDSMTRMYCEFEDDESFKELYEMKADPWQLSNLAYSNDSAVIQVREMMSNRLHEIRNCSGATCRTPSTLTLNSEVDETRTQKHDDF